MHLLGCVVAGAVDPAADVDGCGLMVEGRKVLFFYDGLQELDETVDSHLFLI